MNLVSSTANFNFMDMVSSIDGDLLRDSAIQGINGVFDTGVSVGQKWDGAARAMGETIPNALANAQQPLNDIVGAPGRALDAASGVVDNVVDRFSELPKGVRIPQSLSIPGKGFEEFAPLKNMRNEFTPSILEGDGKLPLNRGFLGNTIERIGGGFQRATNDGAGSIGELMEPSRFNPSPTLEKFTAPVQGLSNTAKAGIGAAGAAIGTNLGLAKRALDLENAQQGLSGAQKLGIGAAGATGLAAGGLGLHKLRTMDE